jgi:hypothetical protein
MNLRSILMILMTLWSGLGVVARAGDAASASGATQPRRNLAVLGSVKYLLPSNWSGTTCGLDQGCDFQAFHLVVHLQHGQEWLQCSGNCGSGSTGVAFNVRTYCSGEMTPACMANLKEDYGLDLDEAKAEADRYNTDEAAQRRSQEEEEQAEDNRGPAFTSCTKNGGQVNCKDIVRDIKHPAVPSNKGISDIQVEDPSTRLAGTGPEPAAQQNSSPLVFVSDGQRFTQAPAPMSGLSSDRSPDGAPLASLPGQGVPGSPASSAGDSLSSGVSTIAGPTVTLKVIDTIIKNSSLTLLASAGQIPGATTGGSIGLGLGAKTPESQRQAKDRYIGTIDEGVKSGGGFFDNASAIGTTQKTGDSSAKRPCNGDLLKTGGPNNPCPQ